MQDATDYIFKVFEQQNVSDRKLPVGTKVHLEMHDEFPDSDGYTNWDDATSTQMVYIAAAYMDPSIPSANLTARIQELIFHELTHVWQFFGDENSPAQPTDLFEGIAEYVPLSAGLKNYNPDKKPGLGDKWDQGYEVTAFFLDYCNSLKPGFVASLNRSLKVKYDENIFEAELGKPVGDLWMDYKSKYADVVAK